MFCNLYTYITLIYIKDYNRKLTSISVFEMKIKGTSISSDARNINMTLVHPIKNVKADSNTEVWQRHEIQEASRNVDNEAALKSHLTYISKMESISHFVILGRS